MTRRRFLATVGAATVAASAVAKAAPKRRLVSPGAEAAVADAQAARAPQPARGAGSERHRPAGPVVRALFGPLGPGAKVGEYTIVAVYDALFGAIPVVLKKRGVAPFQVDVMRRDPTVEAVGSTANLSVFVANHGNGHRWTGNKLGLGAMALAAALRQREAAGAPVPALLNLGERQRRHRGEMFDVLRA